MNIEVSSVIETGQHENSLESFAHYCIPDDWHLLDAQLLSDWMQRGQVDLPEMGQEILQREGEC
jgi:hypothetical protein